MKRNLSLAFTVAAFAAAASTGAHAQRYAGYDDGYAEVVTCESIKKRVAYCEADTRDGVHLLDQFSKASCIEGETWGYDRGRIWVDGGCAGRFGLGGEGR